MTRKQFWILTGSVLVMGVLFLTQVVIARQIRGDELRIAALQRAAQEGNGYYARWERLALRTYQLSLKNPELNEVLVRQQIKVTPKNGANAPAAPSDNTPKTAAPLTAPAKAPAASPVKK